MAAGDALCEDYLRRLTAALSDVPVRDREQILAQIRDHLDEARAAVPVESEAGVRDILERLGPPEDIALAAHGESAPPPEHRDQRRGLGALTVAFALVALGLGVAAFTGAFRDDRTPARQNAIAAGITVPNVIGLDQSQAAAVLRSTGFDPVIAVGGSTTMAPGIVTSQSPAAGSPAPRRSRVAISASGAAPVVRPPSGQAEINPATGSIVVSVPNVVGLSQAQAVAALATSGLDVNVSNSGGLYVRTETPEAGASVPSNSEVIIGMG